MQAMFQAWKHLQKFMTLQRTIHKRGKFRRRQQYQEQVQQQPRAVISVRYTKSSGKWRPNSHTNVCNFEAQWDNFSILLPNCNFFRSTVANFSRQMSRQLYHITKAELQDAILSLRAHKAVPAGCAPTLMWHACADILAPILQSICCRMWISCIP